MRHKSCPSHSFRPIIKGISIYPAKKFASTKSKLRRDLVMSSEADCAYQITAKTAGTNNL
jgi:hypothetical protein